MLKHRLFLIWTITILFIFLGYKKTQARNFLYRDITSLNGLSQNDVQCIKQDSQGFIWIGTNDGLNRYDGCTFKSYTIGSYGLSSNLILSIEEGPKGNLFVGTADEGLFVYNNSKNCFTKVEFKLNNHILKNLNCIKLAVNNRGEICSYDNIAKKVYLFTYDFENNRIKSFISYNLINNNIIDIKSYDNDFYILMIDGIYNLANRDNKVQLNKISSVSGHNINCIDKSNIVVSNYNAVMLINRYKKSEKKFFTNIEPKLLSYSNGNLFFITSSNVFSAKYDKSTNSFVDLKSLCSYKDHIPLSMFIDRNNSLWVGFLKNGIKYFYNDNKPISCFRSFGNNHISSINRYDDNHILIGTEGSGLFLSDNSFMNISPINYMNEKIVYAISNPDSKNNSYVGTLGDGIYKIEHNGYKCIPILKDIFDARALLVYNDYLWIGTYNKGLYRYDLNSGKLIQIKKKNGSSLKIVRNIVKDDYNNLWIATNQGLCLIKAADLNKDKSILTVTNSSDYIIPIFSGKNRMICYGTLGRGLKCLFFNNNYSKYVVRKFNVNSGLSSNTIKGILQDSKGFIWVSTNRGLNRLNLKNNNIRVYDVSDGLQDYEFNELSSYKLDKNNLLFGGVNGINIFNPSNFVTDLRTNIPAVTDFKLFNESVINDSRYNKYIKGNISSTESIELPYNLNSFTFVFSSLNYINPKKIKYKYILEGVDKSWIETNSQMREATYTKLSPGKYIFKLKASSTDGIFYNNIKLVSVIINPPFWQTWYAYLFYVLLVSFILYLIKYYYTIRQERKKELYIANVEKKKSEDMLKMKTDFFTNISHEIRTPLTLILSPLQLLKKNEFFTKNKQITPLLEVMDYNGNLLMKLINELLSFSKYENDKLKLKLKYQNLSSFTKDIYHQFTYLCKDRNINFNYSISNSDINLYFDSYLLEQAIYNLISNAIKHTPQNGSVSISVIENSGNVIISITDSGDGIDDKIKDHIFERFYSDGLNDRISGGTGIGLYLTKRIVEMHNGKISFSSEIGVGTTFTIELPNNFDNKEGRVHEIESIADIENNRSDLCDNVDKKDKILTPLQLGQDTDYNNYLQTVLIVDDNKEMCKILSVLFTPYYKVNIAYDGESAWYLIPELQPDIVVSDIMMPKMNGLQLCEKIKSDIRTSHIPIILLTAKSTVNDLVMGYHFQADAYCVKPFNNQLLLEMINSILKNRKRVNKQNSNILLNPTDVTTTSTDEKFLCKLMGLIEENIGKPEFQVETLCSDLGISSSVLNKKLKSLYGVTANVFIRGERLKRAAKLLKTGRYSIAEVTYDVGFNDLKYFRECFKKRYGILPQQYKDEYSSNKSDIDK